MDWEDFLNMKKPFKPIKITGGTTNGRVISTTKIENERKAELDGNTEELLEHQIREIEGKLEDSLKLNATNGNEDETYMCDPDYMEFYAKYKDKFKFKSNKSSDLPIYASETEILKKISENLTVVIQGNTGCGKSTQVSISIYFFLISVFLFV